MLHRRPPEPGTGLIAIPREREHLAPLVHDLHTLGLPAGAITVFGADEPAIAAALAAEGDAPMRLAPRTPEALAALLEPTARFETFGASVGALAGLLGGLVALALPGSGVLWFLGGAAVILMEETAATLTGLGQGVLEERATPRSSRTPWPTAAGSCWCAAPRTRFGRPRPASKATPRSTSIASSPLALETSLHLHPPLECCGMLK